MMFIYDCPVNSNSNSGYTLKLYNYADLKLQAAITLWWLRRTCSQVQATKYHSAKTLLYLILFKAKSYIPSTINSNMAQEMKILFNSLHSQMAPAIQLRQVHLCPTKTFLSFFPTVAYSTWYLWLCLKSEVKPSYQGFLGWVNFSQQPKWNIALESECRIISSFFLSQ